MPRKTRTQSLVKQYAMFGDRLNALAAEAAHLAKSVERDMLDSAEAERDYRDLIEEAKRAVDYAERVLSVTP